MAQADSVPLVHLLHKQRQYLAYVRYQSRTERGRSARIAQDCSADEEAGKAMKHSTGTVLYVRMSGSYFSLNDNAQRSQEIVEICDRLLQTFGLCLTVCAQHLYPAKKPDQQDLEKCRQSAQGHQGCKSHSVFRYCCRIVR